MYAETIGLGGHEVRSIVKNNQRFVVICDLEHASRCYCRSQLYDKVPEETLSLRPKDKNAPKGFFKVNNKLVLVSLEGLKRYIRNSFYSEETKDKLCRWANKFSEQIESLPPATQNFSFDNNEIRVMEQDGEPWFVAKDVCGILDLTRMQDSVRYLDEDEKGGCLVNTSSGNQHMTVVNEPGLYSLILRSRKPEAKRFQKWVTNDVLPQIRKTGQYSVAGSSDPNTPAVKELHKEINDLKTQIDQKMEQLTQSLMTADNPFVVYRSLDERIEHQILLDRANQFTKTFQSIVNSKAGLRNGNTHVWPKIWNEVNYFVTGLENTQIKAQRRVPDSEDGGIRKLMTQQELERLCDTLEYLNRNLDHKVDITKENVVDTVKKMCIDYFNQKGR